MLARTPGRPRPELAEFLARRKAEKQFIRLHPAFSSFAFDLSADTDFTESFIHVLLQRKLALPSQSNQITMYRRNYRVVSLQK